MKLNFSLIFLTTYVWIFLARGGKYIPEILVLAFHNIFTCKNNKGKAEPRSMGFYFVKLMLTAKDLI